MHPFLSMCTALAFGCAATAAVAAAADLPTYQATHGQRGRFITACIAPDSPLPSYTSGTVSGHAYSPSLHKRWPFTVTCRSDVRDGAPTGSWPTVPVNAGPVTLHVTILTATVLQGVTFQAPPLMLSGNGLLTGQALANVDTEDGQVYYEMDIPLAVNP